RARRPAGGQEAIAQTTGACELECIASSPILIFRMRPELHEAFVAIEPFDLGATMAQQVLGHFDPTGTRGADSFRKVHLTPDGRPVTWVFTRAHNGFLVRVHGTDAAAVLSEFLGCFPLADG